MESLCRDKGAESLAEDSIGDGKEKLSGLPKLPLLACSRMPLFAVRTSRLLQHLFGQCGSSVDVVA